VCISWAKSELMRLTKHPMNKRCCMHKSEERRLAHRFEPRAGLAREKRSWVAFLLSLAEGARAGLAQTTGAGNQISSKVKDAAWDRPCTSRLNLPIMPIRTRPVIHCLQTNRSLNGPREYFWFRVVWDWWSGMVKDLGRGSDVKETNYSSKQRMLSRVTPILTSHWRFVL
jgi:hypothetical protein